MTLGETENCITTASAGCLCDDYSTASTREAIASSCGCSKAGIRTQLPRLPNVYWELGGFLVSIEYTLGLLLRPENSKLLHQKRYDCSNYDEVNVCVKETVDCYKRIFVQIKNYGCGMKVLQVDNDDERLLKKKMVNLEAQIEQLVNVKVEYLPSNHRRNPMRRYQPRKVFADALADLDRAVMNSVARVKFVLLQICQKKKQKLEEQKKNYEKIKTINNSNPNSNNSVSSDWDYASGVQTRVPVSRLSSVKTVELLQKNRKRVSDGLYKFVLWREALKAEKQRLVKNANMNEEVNNKQWKRKLIGSKLSHADYIRLDR